MSHHPRHRAPSARAPHVGTSGLASSSSVPLLVSPQSIERERALRDLLEREMREREMGLHVERPYPYDYENGVARDPRLQLTYTHAPVVDEREYARTRVYPRGLDQFGVGAGDADHLYEAKYPESFEDDEDVDRHRHRHTHRHRSQSSTRRHSRSPPPRSRSPPRSRLESYAEERARDAAERERERLRRRSPSPSSRDRFTAAEEREYRASRHELGAASLAAGLGAMTLREREAALQRERDRDWDREDARRRARERERAEPESRRSSSQTRTAWKSSTGPLAPSERVRLGSPSRTALRSPLPSPVGGYGSRSAASYSSAIHHDERVRHHDRDRDLRSLDRRDRERAREAAIADAGRFGASLARTGGLSSHSATEYDSDEERVFHHPRKHGAHAYYQQQFDGYAEPVATGLGGSGGTRSGRWLDEFYRPVDVRSSQKWSASLQPPSYTLRNHPGAPESRLKLEWVYGYKSFDVRNNLVYNNVGDIVYPVASVVVVYKHAHRIQRHFQAHNDEVRCLAQHPINLNLIASGQTASFARDENGRAPHIAVWDSTDFSRVWVLRLTPEDRSIRALAFSGDGQYLASISNDAHHTIKLWSWETRTLLGSSRGDSYALFAIKWNHKDPSEFVTVGKHHAVFWSFNGVKLTARKAHLPGGKNVTFYSIAFSEKGYACLGGDDGGIYVFVDGRLVREFKKVHAGKVFCLDWFPGGLVSGGGDGVVHVLDKKLEVVRTFTFHHRITSLYVRGNHLLVGTQGSQIFEIVDFMDTNIEGDNRTSTLVTAAGAHGYRPGHGHELQGADGRIGVEPIVSGHYDGELHGIATTPGGREIVSVGEDNQIAVWEMTTHRLLRRAHLSDEPAAPESRAQVARRRAAGASVSSHPLHQCGRAVAVSPNGKFITVGLNNGEVAVYTAHDLRRVFTHDLNQYSKRQQHSRGSRRDERQHPHWIQCIKYSPNGHVVAIGTHGAVVVLLDTRDDYRVKGVLKTHESFVTNLDFSDDGTFLASTDGQYQLKFHQLFENDLAQSTEVQDQRQLRDVKWSSQKCVLGFGVQGILETGESEGYLINCLEVSPSRAFVVSGDDAGQVQLFRFPVLEKGHHSHAYHSHASHVVAVTWSADEKYVISAGGHDNAICQWTIV